MMIRESGLLFGGHPVWPCAALACKDWTYPAR